MILLAREGVEPPDASLFRAAYYQLIPAIFQQLNFAEWPQFCDHSVTSADVRLSVGAVGLSSTDSGDLKVAKVRIFSSAHSPKARSTALMERRRFFE